MGSGRSSGSWPLSFGKSGAKAVALWLWRGGGGAGASTRASPATANAEFRDKYARAREASRIFGVFRRLYAGARCERNGPGRPNFQFRSP